MPKQTSPFLKSTAQFRNTCLYLHAQRSARALARRFDDAFRSFDITSGQFVLLIVLNRAEPATIGLIATLLVMDRLTLIASLKPLQRKGLAVSVIDSTDRRV